MCNCIHKDSEAISVEGVGYKVLYRTNNKHLHPINNVERFYKRRWIYWDNEKFKSSRPYLTGDGFCFFLSLREARKLINAWKNTHFVIHRIEYKQGLGKHKEDNITTKKAEYQIALCKEFRILERIN